MLLMKPISNSNKDIPLSLNRGIVEQHPERESFVVERFSADLVPLRNILKSALKRSTTNLTCGRFMVPMRAKKEWRLPMNLPRPRSGGEEQGRKVPDGHHVPLWGERAGRIDRFMGRKHLAAIAGGNPLSLCGRGQGEGFGSLAMQAHSFFTP